MSRPAKTKKPKSKTRLTIRRATAFKEARRVVIEVLDIERHRAAMAAHNQGARS